MGAVTVEFIIWHDDLNPGQWRTWYWNNPDPKSVYSFSAVPHGAKNNQWATTIVTEVGFSEHHLGKQRVQFKVNNVSPPSSAIPEAGQWYEVLMSRATFG